MAKIRENNPPQRRIKKAPAEEAGASQLASARKP